MNTRQYAEIASKWVLSSNCAITKAQLIKHLGWLNNKSWGVRLVAVGSDLSGSNLRRSDLRRSDLSGSDLRGSNLRGSDLRRSDLSGSEIFGHKVRSLFKFEGLYDYTCYVFKTVDSKVFIKMGCKLHAVDEWDSDFWNNSMEFPNDGSNKPNKRLNAFKFIRGFAEIGYGIDPVEEVK